jgi:hypothetical protein
MNVSFFRENPETTVQELARHLGVAIATADRIIAEWKRCSGLSLTNYPGKRDLRAELPRRKGTLSRGAERTR